jgi:UDP-3-O-acyl-N-acetylglucosamine deacetylase
LTYHRKTVRDTVTIEGIGLHTAVPVVVKVFPGADGIWFRTGSDRVKARPENVTDTSRATRLGRIGTVEHLMSALCGLEITDAEIEVDGIELPGMDGSARPFVEALQTVGLESLEEYEPPTIFQRNFFHEESVKISMAKGTGHWRYIFNTAPRWPGEQIVESFDVVGAYADEIAPNRTLVMSEELPMVEKYGLGKGLDETSVLVIGPEGYLNEPRSEREPAWHKLLDLMGDLYLAGLPARSLSVVAEKSGHRTNVAAAAMLLASVTH